MRQVILDTETTGFSPKSGDRVIEIGCVEVIDREITDNQYHVYINPQGKLVGDSFKVHGISDDFLVDKPLFTDIVDEFLTWIGNSEIIAHNAKFDIDFLDHELYLSASNIRLSENNLITDSLVLARENFPNQRNTLDALCSRFNVDNSGRDLHGALIDADLLAQVYLGLTGGQFSLLDDDSGKGSGDGFEYAVASSEQELSAYLQRVPVIKAGPEDLALHQEYLEKLGVSKEKLW
jgi:DNA polymerase-3 subunit epsilon